MTVPSLLRTTTYGIMDHEEASDSPPTVRVLHAKGARLPMLWSLGAGSSSSVGA